MVGVIRADPRIQSTKRALELSERNCRLHFLAIVLLCGCFSPPIIREGGSKQIQLDRFPHGTEEVVLEVGDDGEFLRGVWVPGDTDRAGVVLHFMPTGVAIASGWKRIPQLQIMWDLRDRGLASLFLDYRGVGASDGTPHAGNLREDAQVMWDEAMRRVGDPKRIVLRGNSLGGLGIATLLERGITPAAIVIAAPVLDDTVAYNVASDEWGAILGWLIDAFIFHRPVGVDLDGVLAQCRAPQLLMTGDEDEYLEEAGRTRLAAGMQTSGGTLVIEPGFTHLDAGIEGHYLLPGESDLYSRLFPDSVRLALRISRAGKSVVQPYLEAVVARWRVDPPDVAFALARIFDQHTPERRLDNLVTWYRNLVEIPIDRAGRDALLNFDDPAAPVDPSELKSLRPYAFGKIDGELVPTADLGKAAFDERMHCRAYLLPENPRGFDRVWSFPVVVDIDRAADGVEIPSRLLLPPEDSLRHVVRLLLKNRGIPDRVLLEPAGRPTLQWRDPDGQWKTMELPPVH